MSKPEKDTIDTVMRLTEEYRGKNPDRLLLGENSIPVELRKEVATQLECASSLFSKVRLWHDTGCYVPDKLSVEQCSGMATALYKQRFVRKNSIVADITGGLGVDSSCLARIARKLIYVERNERLCRAAEYNFHRLGLDNIEILNGDLNDWWRYVIEQGAELLYIDPARREQADKYKRVYALRDCEPNVSVLMENIRAYCKSKKLREPDFLIKVSPMLDLSALFLDLPGISRAHIVSVSNEVKEILLYVCGKGETHTAGQIPVHVVDLNSLGEENYTLTGSLDEEKELPASVYAAPESYLYEPGASVMKSGLFKTIASRYRLSALAANSHLYTSREFVSCFPGRSFGIRGVLPFKSSVIKNLKKEYPRAQITCRNFPLSVDELRKKTGIKDGFEVIFYATTLYSGERVLLRCERIGLESLGAI
ncbi:THUMP-like domain-containing protein [Porphyromonas macacae]|uniref:Uncharacterized protein n=1 Tax=Porphyromonas macacae TaxID=28115 RepID=A0A379DL81_9PORP|nr:hypothetical protein [Porphyromonas macacae]SUB78535.1 Uncharacterised protein [Porphyromonas macacae]